MQSNKFCSSALLCLRLVFRKSLPNKEFLPIELPQNLKINGPKLKNLVHLYFKYSKLKFYHKTSLT
jgi:hypothetical protein